MMDTRHYASPPVSVSLFEILQQRNKKMIFSVAHIRFLRKLE